MTVRHSRGVLLVLLATLALGACGGDGGASGDDPAAVRADVTRAMTSTDADVCEPRAFATQRFVDQQTYSIAQLAAEAEKICRADPETYASDSVEVSRVKVDGDRATASVTARGGAYGFGDLELALVKDRVWKIDELTGVEIDRPRFNALQVRFAGIGDEKASREQTACTVRRLDRLDDAELEQAVLRADVALIADPVLVCFLRPELRDQGLAPQAASCVLRALRATSEEFLRVVLEEDEAKTEELFTQAAAGCGDGGATA